MQEAADRLGYVCAPASAGPIVYHPQLGAGRMDGFYESLGSRLEAKGDREALAALEDEGE